MLSDLGALPAAGGGLTRRRAAIGVLAALVAGELALRLAGRIGPMVHAIAMVALLLGLEAAIRGWSRSALKRIFIRPSISTGYDVLIYFLFRSGTSMFLAFFLSLGLPLVSIQFWAKVGQVLPPASRLHTGSAAGDLAVFIVIFTFVDYWNHRLLHSGPFWFLHRMHHSATEMNLITSPRNNPCVLALELFTKSWPYVLVAESPALMAAFFVLEHPHQLVLHSMLDWRFGWVGRWVVLSPVGHRIHHSPLPEHWDRNFSNYTPFWDRLFGTYYDGEVVNDRVGLPEPLHDSGNIVREWIEDVVAFWKGLAGVIARRR